MAKQRWQANSSTSCILLILLFLLVLTSCNTIEPEHNKTSIEHDNRSNVASESTITLAQITNDVTYLASDALKGRANFSPEIHHAADFIAKRFSEIGLVPQNNESSFKQQYTVQRIIPNTLHVELNGKTLNSDNLSMVTRVKTFEWRSEHPSQNKTNHSLPNIVTVNENSNMRKALKHLNQRGGQHLVLLHPSHKKSFLRYKSHFANGLTTLVNSSTTQQNGIIVIALTEINDVKQYSVKANAMVSNTRLSNIVGILPGKEKANEIVLFSAHYDHIGVKANIDEQAQLTDKEQVADKIFNGADDDASGISAILSLANHFTKTSNNERTLVFSAFSAEEIGGFGAKYFASQINANNLTAMINIEMIGKTSAFGEGNVWMTGMEHSNLGEQLNQALAAKKLKIYADPYGKENLFYRSDNAPFAKLGVPAHSFSSTALDTDKHYHQVSDDVKSLNFTSMLKSIKLLAIATTPLVEGAVTPSRITPEKAKSHGLIY